MYNNVIINIAESKLFCFLDSIVGENIKNILFNSISILDR